LLLERLPPTEEFMKNFAVEVLGYLLSPFFDDNNELLGIEIIDFFFSLFFPFSSSFFPSFFFYKGSPTSYLGYNELREEINYNLGSFIWKPNNHFGSSSSVGDRFLGGKRHVFAYFQGRSNKIYVGVSDLDLGSMTILSTRVLHGLTKLNTKQAAYELVFLV
jgi:hypothetical protein